MNPVPVLVLFGPTASGKTALLDRLFGSAGAYCKAEIISADSMQVYRGMDIGTAKPTPGEQNRIPHHLIDILDPCEQFNAGEFVRLAKDAIQSISSRGNLPVVSGGTGFYLRNLILGLPAAPPSDPEIRCSLKQELVQNGARHLFGELAEKDPISAAKIHINDEYRLLRALEVIRLTGQPLSSFAQNSAINSSSGEGPGLPVSPFRFLIIGLKREREELYKRINERCAAMFRDGLPNEVKGLFEAGYTPNDPGLRAIGYREFFIENHDINQKTVPSYRLSNDYAGVEALVAQNSRRYAKRQNVFFASIPNVNWITETNPKAAVEKIRSMLD